MDFIAEFLKFLSDSDIPAANPSEIIADDKKRRYTLIGDKADRKNGSYQLMSDGGFAVGWAHSFKQGITHKFHTKSNLIKFSQAEREEYKRKVDLERKRKAREIAAGHAEAALRAQKLWNIAVPRGETEYLKRKQTGLNNARIWRNLVVVPVYVKGKLACLQFIAPSGDKMFLKKGEIEGGYCPLAKKGDDLSTIVICEGFATGDSIKKATGLAVIVAFNAGNLKPVASVMRKKYPESKIIIAADNDQWTTKPDGVTPWNPGIAAAKVAAITAGNAHIVWPDVASDDAARRTDFNDIFVSQGPLAVKDRITAEAVMEPLGEYPPGNMDDSQLPEGQSLAPEPFRVLGHNDGTYYFLPKDGGQIVGLSMSAMSNITNLFRLARLEFWSEGFEDISHRKLAVYKANMLANRAHRIGIFRPINVRGVGAWIDQGRKIMHCGGELAVDDDKINPYEFKSQYVYPMAPATASISEDALNNRQANRLREICQKISWENKLSGELLAGWCVIAPVCAALNWRPHIWVTGESQSGKSTVIDKIIMPVVGELAIRLDGGTTEAAIRQKLGYAGRPVILDEAESETPRDKMIMENVLQLARRASSGSSVSKGTAGGEGIEYTIRSSFCFSGINPVIKHRADESRITQLVLRKSRATEADQIYKALRIEIKEVLTKEYGQKMLNRTFKHLDVLLHNCDIFADAAADVLCDRRAADQIGPMLAGLFLLTSTKRVEHAQAVDWIEKHDWKTHTAISEQADPERLLMYITTKFIKLGASKEDTIGNLIRRATQEQDEDSGLILRKYGIWPREDSVWFANRSPNLEALLKDTPWYNWKRPLMDIQGAVRHEPVYFAPGISQRSVAIPYSSLHIEDGTFSQPEEELPFT